MDIKVNRGCILHAQYYDTQQKMLKSITSYDSLNPHGFSDNYDEDGHLTSRKVHMHGVQLAKFSYDLNTGEPKTEQFRDLGLVDKFMDRFHLN